MTEYHFNAELAQRHGVNGAIFLHAMAFWIAKNQANGRHFHEGRTWTYNTLEALAKLFPFWTRRQVERIVARLKEDGVLLTGNFSQDKTDRTVWYALADSVLEVYGLLAPAIPPDGEMDPPEPEGLEAPISPNSEMHFTNAGHPFPDSVKCNKETVTDQLYIPPLPPKGERSAMKGDKQTVRAMLHAYVGEDQELAQALDDLMEVRSAKKAVDSPRAISTLLNKLDKLADGSRELKLQIIRESVTNSWKGVFPLRGGQAPAARKGVERHVE